MNFLGQLKNKNYSRRGMTFLELLIAIFVIIVGIAGTIGLIHNTVAASFAAATRIKAAYLAQEGIEVVKNVRDSNWVRDVHWLTNIPVCDCCEVAFNHPSGSPIGSCPGGVPRLLRFHGGFYAYSADPGAVDTIFRRRMRLTTHGTTETINEHLRVKATVSWEIRGVTHSLTVVENFYNWR